MKKLSIIIPVYNCNSYTDELLDVLNKQVTKDVEVLVIDDGSKEPYESKYKWAKVIRKNNGGASSARNVGLDNSTGEYIAYIDGDDLVPDYYVSKILDKIDEEHFDYCYLSWKTIGDGWKHQKVLNKLEDEFDAWNLCVWNRIWRLEPIKDIRFNENKQIAEDAEYIKDTKPFLKKKSFIHDNMYLYRTDVVDSLTKRFARGELDMDRIVYNIPQITKDMKHLVNEVKELNKTGEVIIMTNKNDIEELSKYAMIMKPQVIKGTELRGIDTPLFHKIEKPTKAQVIIWTQTTLEIGGLETFIYNFCQNMKDKYDILVLYKTIHINQLKRLSHIVRCEEIKNSKTYKCETLIINRISDVKPDNVIAGKVVNMIHGCKLLDRWTIPTGRDVYVPVSSTVYNSFVRDGVLNKNNSKVIHNMSYYEEPKKVLKLISATRLSFEKGEDRIIKLAKGLNEHNIPFVWFLFSDRPLKENVNGIIQMRPTLDVRNYVAMCDYMVALSDSEAWGYSIVESLELGIPVITTPIEVLGELGFKDGRDGLIVPFDVKDVDYDKIYTSKFKVKYKSDNDVPIQEWATILGESTEQKEYVYKEPDRIRIKAIRNYKDIDASKNIKIGDIYEVDVYRAEEIIRAGFAIEYRKEG